MGDTAIVKFADWVQSDEVLTSIQKANRTDADAMQVAAMVALTVSSSKKLSQCSRGSILKCSMQCIGLGLLPDISGQAYLVPFKTTCTLIVGYRGFIQLGYRSGMIAAWNIPELVFEGDFFEHPKGDDERIEHQPRKQSDKVVGVYNIVDLNTGGKVRCSMTIEEVMKCKAKSRGSNSEYSPWQTDINAMIMKCPVRRIAKFVPSSNDLQRAVSVDEAGETARVEQYPGQLGGPTRSNIMDELTDASTNDGVSE